ncbi:MAG: glycosyltransferase [Lachnospiraceae bacterium]|nr:glycosyltransferase [Lachnospiraceae bacterium]
MKKRHISDPLAEARRLEQERLERERQEMIMAQNDISVISLDNNIENSYIGQGMTEREPEVLYTKEAKRVVRSLNHLETRRVMLVNTVVGTGSVGRLVEGLYNTLTANGYECMVAYGRDTHPEGMNAYRIGQDIDVYIHGALSRLTDRHGFYSKRATLEFINVIEEFSPDIIHLHNVHGYYLNIRVLFEYLKTSGIRVIWTLHDCWTFTGHCSHFEYIGCMKWTTGCYSCEQLSEYPKSVGKDNSQRNYADKKELFTGFDDLTIVTPSQWLKSRVEQSFMGEYHTVVVPTGIDTSVFHPIAEERKDDNLVFRLRNSLNLRNKNVLLGVANPWRTRKGIMQFVSLSKLINERCVIVLVGLDDDQISSLPESIIGIGHTDSVYELAALYSMADIYVNLTLEDTFPTTNIEALACGTPVITYRSGGSAESIDDTCGIAVERNSVQGVVAAIDTILSQKGIAYTADDCVRHAMLYDKETRFEEYIREVYEGM